MTFSEDIKSKHLSNYVLVTIGDIDEPTHRISTNKVRLGEDYYKPILLNIPSISESLDVENRKYKISSVRLSISDYEEDGERFSDSLNTLMNNEVNIYYASQSCQTLDDCYLAGTYIVRSFTQDENNVNLTCEDLSQDKLHKDLPLANLGSDDYIPDKYKNKPIPMVFGKVEKSPCLVISQAIDGDEVVGISVLVDYNINYEDGNYFQPNILENEIPITYEELLVFIDDYYYSIRRDGQYFHDNYALNLSSNIQNHNSPIIKLEATYNDDGTASNNIANGYVDTVHFRKPLAVSELRHGALSPHYPTFQEMSKILNYANIADNYAHVDEQSFTVGSRWGFTITLPVLGIDNFVYPSTTKLMRSFLNIAHWGEVISGGEDEIFIKAFNATSTDYIDSWNFINLNSTEDNYGIEFGFSDNDPLDISSTSNWFQINTFNGGLGQSANILNWEDYTEFPPTWTRPDQVTAISFYNESAMGASPPVINYKLYGIGIIHYIPLLLGKIVNQRFFTNVIGRGGENLTLQKTYEEILGEDVLDSDVYNSDLASDFSLGNYAFTVDKTISSKKLMEELSESSGLFPYFKNGEFNVKAIKSDYADNDKGTLIKTEDVLSYKYDRTKIEKVYSKVNVKFHYDYGLKDYTKETGFIQEGDLEGITSVYDPLYFGDDFDQELVFESKYIRNPDTAMNLAKYLFGTYCNQHNFITVELGLQYLELELGQIVHFDGLIQGRKIFGEDYNYHYERNGQLIHPFFFITQIKKNLETVELKLYQLHYFSFDTPFTLGCTDNSASEGSFDVLATHNDGSCIYDEITVGCMSSNALNYNSNANSEGVCVFQDDGLQRTEITSHENDFVLPLPEEIDITEEIIEEQEVEILSNNLFNNPPANTHFEQVYNEWSDLGLQISHYGHWNPTSAAILYTADQITSEDGLPLGATVRCFSDNSLFGIWNDRIDHFLADQIQYYQSSLFGKWRVTFSAKKEIFADFLTGDPANYLFIRLFGSGLDSTPVQLTTVMTEYAVDIEVPENLAGWITHSKLIIVACSDSDKNGCSQNAGFTVTNVHIFKYVIEIQETITEEVVGIQIIDSVLNLAFTKSPNLLEPISELISYTPSGDYLIEIRQLNNQNNSYDLLWSHENIPAIAGQDQYQTQINFSNLNNIPQHTGLELWIKTYSTSFLGGQGQGAINVFNPPSITETMPFSWGEIEEENTSVIGDANNDNVISVIDVMILINIVLGTGGFTEEILGAEEYANLIASGDTNGDGNITIADIVFNINTILYS